MKRLEAMGASYFILDLRDNLGGLVQVFKIVLRMTFSLLLPSLLHEECHILHGFPYPYQYSGCEPKISRLLILV